MHEVKELKDYREELRESLANEFQRGALDRFAQAYPLGRAKAFAGLDVPGLIEAVAAVKDAAAAQMMELYAEFKRNAEKAGVHVHLARTAREANEIIARIAADNGVKKIVKSKSMTAEETHLNQHLEPLGFEVTETDLGEWIIQLRHEGPTHMVMPAIHLSRNQVADLFTKVTGNTQPSDIERLVKVARRELRPKYVEADMGISGANFALADSGTLGIVTNEGNMRLVTTLPRVHVALVGLEKLLPSLHEALVINRVLPRNATGQAITSYVTWITGANPCAVGPDGKKEMHVVFLDNGRSAMAKDPNYAPILRCIRCGACANVCPVYRLVGGHKYGYVYIGAIGLILTYFFHGREKARNLIQNCINCQACKAVCASGIDLPEIIKKVHAQIQDEEGHPLQSKMLGLVLSNRRLFHTLLRTASLAQKPVTSAGYIRHLPMIFSKEQNFRALPAIAAKPFRDRWEKIRPKAAEGGLKVALFSGCVQDFVYPEQMEAAVKVMAKGKTKLDFPMDQSCCGLPAMMMGEVEAAREVALKNVRAMDPADYDYIVTMCASCASHLKHAYPKLLAEGHEGSIKAAQFADKVIDFSSFVRDVLGMKDADFSRSLRKVAYHAPCHLCRGMGVRQAPRELVNAAAEYAMADEEEVCCGFGGTYSMKFPEVSEQLLSKKLDNVEKTGATLLVTDCPGCVMQLRGGAKKSGKRFEVKHIAELLAEQVK